MWNAQVFGWNSLGSFGGGENTPSDPPDRGCRIGGKPRGGLPPYIDFLRFSLHNMAIIENLMFLYLWSFPSSMPEMVFKLFKHHHEKLPTKFLGDKIAFFLGGKWWLPNKNTWRIGTVPPWPHVLYRRPHQMTFISPGIGGLQDFLETIQRLQLLYVTGFKGRFWEDLFCHWEFEVIEVLLKKGWIYGCWYRWNLWKHTF